jgi:hypothetical protein
MLLQQSQKIVRNRDRGEANSEHAVLVHHRLRVTLNVGEHMPQIIRNEIIDFQPLETAQQTELSTLHRVFRNTIF